LEFGIQFRRETGLCLFLCALICQSLALNLRYGGSGSSLEVCGLLVLLLLPLTVDFHLLGGPVEQAFDHEGLFH
jgi:hypothetical protein